MKGKRLIFLIILNKKKAPKSGGFFYTKLNLGGNNINFYFTI